MEFKILTKENRGQYWKVLWVLAAVTVIGFFLNNFIGFRAVGFLYLAAILGLSLLYSLGPVLFAAVLSTFAWNFFFIPPIFTLAIASSEDVMLCVSYFVAAITTGYLANRVKHNEETSKAADLLRESEKLHQALLNSVSHELRTPLTAIIGTASALAEDSVQDRPQARRELSTELVRSCNRLNRVIDNLLDMTRLNSGVLSLKKDWFELKELVTLTVRRIEPDLGDHPVVYDFQDVPLAKIDFRLLEQVLANLLLNAVAYAPAGTPIHIRVASSGNKARISIRDFGRGIPESSLPYIFDKFYRVPGSPSGGTGLGLYIAKSFVEAHQGTMQMINHPEGGAEFIIELPLEPLPQIPEGRMPEGQP